MEPAYYGGLTQSELAGRSTSRWARSRAAMFAGLERLRVLLAEAGYETA